MNVAVLLPRTALVVAGPDGAEALGEATHKFELALLAGGFAAAVVVDLADGSAFQGRKGAMSAEALGPVAVIESLDGLAVGFGGGGVGAGVADSGFAGLHGRIQRPRLSPQM